VIAQPGDVVPVGQRIALILAPGEEETKTPVPVKPTPLASTEAESALTRVNATPVAARLAAEHHLDITQIKPQGGLIRKEDVLAS
jgi:pyruvate dehydrogenase E2 component (dihydrolipoamide acetyltransferase)